VAATQQAANHARRLLVGGLMTETPEDTSRYLARKKDGLVLYLRGYRHTTPTNRIRNGPAPVLILTSG
jgi:hypothetical protein